MIALVTCMSVYELDQVMFCSCDTAVLVLYLTFYLHFDEDTSTSLYHSFIVLCYATPLLGAIIADSLLGKFKSVLPYHIKPPLHKNNYIPLL